MIKLDPISKSGTRDYTIDLSGALEADEVITSVNVISDNSSVLVVTSGDVNASDVEHEGVTIAAGKGVTFSVTGQGSATPTVVPISLTFVGDDGSRDTYELMQPIVPRLKSL